MPVDKFDDLNRTRLPRVGITIGDAAGIGPEVVLKAVAELSSSAVCQPVIIGDAEFLGDTARRLNLPFDYQAVSDESKLPPIAPFVFDVPNIREKIEFGVESATTGRAAAQYIETAVRLCLNRRIDAMTTAPISKNALAMAGYKFPGHTEFLAHLTDTEEFAMSFFGGNLRVVLLSTHLSLRAALDLIKREPLVRLIKLTDRELQKLGFNAPRIAVAALNPHAGENRLFGSEEVDEINPAVAEARDFGINASGAHPADTIFARHARGEFDAVIALYHDQATIPVKSIAFGEAVNVTLGLPIIRTSVDHGTAFDIAGRNLAEHSSMKTAVILAANLSQNARR